VIVLIATAVVYFRVLLEVYLVGPSLFPEAAPRLGLMATVASGSSALAWLSIRREPGEMPETGQGGELKSAIAFALLYAAVLLGVATARYYLGDPGLFLAAGLSGMTDMDAITLSTSRLAERLELEPSAAWRMILIASLSNILFKAAIVGMLGSAELLRRVTPWFVLQLFLGAALILLG
jgi:uncharacterized membrane protein (DUF4010 family)